MAASVGAFAPLCNLNIGSNATKVGSIIRFSYIPNFSGLAGAVIYRRCGT